MQSITSLKSKLEKSGGKDISIFKKKPYYDKFNIFNFIKLIVCSVIKSTAIYMFGEF